MRSHQATDNQSYCPFRSRRKHRVRAGCKVAQVVYRLYGLTEDDIKIVEGSA